MEKSYRLQVPLSEDKKKMLETKSEDVGFASSTDAVRFLINNFLNGSINIDISSGSSEKLDKETELEVLQSLVDKAKGKVKAFNPHDKNFHKNILEFANE